MLAVGFFFSAVLHFFSGALIAIKKEKYVLFTNVLFLIINFFMNYYLIPIYGNNGAAIATISSFIGIFIFLYIFVRSNLKDFKSLKTDFYLLICIFIGVFFVLSRIV